MPVFAAELYSIFILLVFSTLISLSAVDTTCFASCCDKLLIQIFFATISTTSRLLGVNPSSYILLSSYT
jgi:hypothetical protein